MNYRFGDCELDTGLYVLQRGGKTIRLRPKVFRVCLYLLEHRDRVVSREELCQQVWSGQFISQTTLEGVIRAVRQAVGDSGQTQSIIQTLHGYGYRFVAPVEERATSATGIEGRVMMNRPLEGGKASLDQRASAADRVTSGLVAEDGTDLEWRGEASSDVIIGEQYLAASGPGMTAASRGGAGSQLPRRRLWSWAMITSTVLFLSFLGGWQLWRGVRTPEVGALDKSRIAVLPFLNLSAEADRGYFADGITEVVIAQLSQVPGLTVVARTSVMKYKDTRKDVLTIGRELGVGTLLEGSVRTFDNQMRVNAQLIDVSSQGHLWSQEFEGDVTAVFGIQKDIATRVAQQLTKQLIGGGNMRVGEENTGQLDALTLNLRGE
jgi:TolB-like protein/DNA-binding winged helix-turn-helix (wHTH) protein